ncbi:hypothetical protein ACC764_37185 [Rhizobium ruizarguesonis]|jgi:hypothetical protein
MTNVLSFKFEKTDGDAVAILPCVDGVGLDQLVATFERTNGYRDPAGGYGGLIPSHYFFGPLPSYFLGQEEPVIGDEQGEIYVLSCECGEVGCWPLVAHVRLHEDKVVWDDFSQPHRPSRKYENFGPFVFERKQYEKAVEALVRYDDL